MKAIEIARKLAALERTKEACAAYGVAIHESGGQDPAAEMEAALYTLQNGGDYKVSYTTFVELFRRGQFREDCLSILTHAFYEPNIKLLKTRYQNNCKLLAKYPYIFRKDFLEFEFLPIRFYPFDDNRYTPYLVREEEFGGFVDMKKPVITRNFFRDLENPILAKDVYSQYELEYLNDNVRKSEYVARENHIYLHYTSWAAFCAHLQVLNLRPLLEDKKIVFLIEEEEALYPIDFKERFGIDYSQNTVKPFGIREINRLIWHTQLSSHNGGDFFNEIFDIHPNLLMFTSIMLKNLTETIEVYKAEMEKVTSVQSALRRFPKWNPRMVEELYRLRDRTDKDFLTAIFLNQAEEYEKKHAPYLDRASRIVPALFFQPHFSNIIYSMKVDDKGRTVLMSDQYEAAYSSPIFRGFKYIKTFTPMRRLTTSHAGTMRYMHQQLHDDLAAEEPKGLLIPDVVSQRVLNRSFMIDWQDRLYADSVLVRFEDGKLNPKATFTALCAFLDLPYTESMTYCSLDGVIDPKEFEASVQGFDTATVYRTYDEYANDAERTYIEYFLRDAYEYYGYDFHYYDGQPMDEARVQELVENFTTINGLSNLAWKNIYLRGRIETGGQELTGTLKEAAADQIAAQQVQKVNENRVKNAKILMRGLFFVNKRGQPLHMMPKLELDPALLEQPLYH